MEEDCHYDIEIVMMYIFELEVTRLVATDALQLEVEVCSFLVLLKCPEGCCNLKSLKNGEIGIAELK